ncbi:MAG TPA: serine protease [Acidobacteriota bacterium]|nr:serine protease [Acidobacteriota bacterium]
MLDLASVQAGAEEDLLGMANVQGVALGHKVKDGQETKEPAISVLVSHKVDPALLSSENRVPKSIKNVKTDVVEVGEIFAGDQSPGNASEETEADAGIQAAPFSPGLRRRLRPARGGFSVSLAHQGGTGTIATGCYDLTPFPSKPSAYYILSNNHVLANSNAAPIGSAVIQPGRVDGGVFPRDFIGKLRRFIPIRFISGGNAPCNYVDAAIAECNLQDLDRDPFWGGPVKTLYTAPKVGDIVQKAGRTTGFTTGRVTAINATVNVNYGGGRVARFCRQIVTSDMSAPGDSGSLVTNLDEGAVGLLFAGSSVATIINNIAFVQLLLRVRITEK